MDTEPTPLDAKELEERLKDIEKMSVSPVYRDFVGFLESEKKSILDNVLELPRDVSSFLSRERMLGIAEELQVLIGWLDDEKSTVEEALKQLKLEKDTQELTTSNED